MFGTGGARPFSVSASGFLVFVVTGILGEVWGRRVLCSGRGFAGPTDAFGTRKAGGWQWGVGIVPYVRLGDLG